MAVGNSADYNNDYNPSGVTDASERSSGIQPGLDATLKYGLDHAHSYSFAEKSST